MEDLERKLHKEETKLSFLRTSIENTWFIYMAMFIVLSLGMYGLEIIFGIDHKEYTFDGIYICGLLVAFIIHIWRLYKIKIIIRDALQEDSDGFY